MVSQFLPPVTDEEIFEVCKLLKLPQQAFHGVDGNAPRHEALKSMTTLDIEACPGSGKTTLLVAKLALMGKRWPYRTKGICVLSHTNAARDEIEKKLGSTEVGQSILRYPNFVGTIHGFVNEFIAMPWLHSIGYSPKVIEDELTLNWRWNQLSYATRGALENKRANKNLLRIKEIDFTVGDIKWGKGTLNKFTKTYQNIVEVNKSSIEKGYFTFEELFVWANDALSKNGNIQELLRNRFPMLFIDEIQDNSEIQSATLHKVFMEGENQVIRQRFGDSNQAIYNYSGQPGSTTDSFPSGLAGVRKELPNSHRFGTEIASLANNFAINSLEKGLQGHGPNMSKANAPTDQKHLIFLFKDDEIDKVLPEYAKHILEVFADNPEGLKQGDFVAVGAVHTKPDKLQKPPHYIGDYYPDYKSELSKKEPSPKTFPEYIMVGKYLSSLSSSSFPLIEKYSEAILKATHIAGEKLSATRRKRKHNYIVESLMNMQENSQLHKDQIQNLIKSDLYLTKKIWEESWIGNVSSIVSGLAGDDVEMDKVEQFLAWPEEIIELPISNESSATSNCFYYPNQETADIAIRLGSIHSVKGQNHTATLVLETFNKTYHLQKLKDWILGKRRTPRQISDQSGRLKLHYVAMTRPTHLLCLAMKFDSFSPEERDSLAAGNCWNIKVL